MKILIDNGHGVDTAGKRSPDNSLREYKYAREISEKIVSELKKQGYDAERIVKEEADISLSERCRRVNSVCDRYGVNNVILVSVHCNAAGDGSRWLTATGWSAFTTKGQTKSDLLANCLYDAAKKYLPGQKIRQDFSDNDADWEENFYILSKTKCPAVLTENFFQDNQQDVQFLLSDNGKDAIVKLHVFGIINYINSI